MTQVGTSAFAADSPCHPTTVTLMGAADGWSATLAEPLKAYAKDLAKYSDGYQMKMEMTMGADIAAEASVTTCIRNDKALLEAVWYVFQVPTLMIPLPSKEETVCMAVLYVFDEAETEGKCTDNCQCASYRRCNGEICYLDPIDMKIQLEIQAKIKLALNPPKIEVKIPDVEIKVKPIKIEVEVPDIEIEVPDVEIEVCVPEIEIEVPDVKIEVKVPDIEIKVPDVKIEVKLPEIKLPSVYFCNGYTNKRPMCFTAKASDDGALAEGGLSAKSFECVEPADFLTGGLLTMGNLADGTAITAKSNGAVFAGESLKMGDKVSVTYYQPIANNNEDYRPPKPMSDADRLKFALLAAGIVELPKIDLPKLPDMPKIPKIPKIEAPKLDKQCRPILPKLEMPKLEMPVIMGPDGKPMKGAFEKGGFFDTHPWFWKYKVPEKQLLPRFSPKFSVSSFAGSSDKIAPCMMLVKLTGAAQLVAGAAAVTVALF